MKDRFGTRVPAATGEGGGPSKLIDMATLWLVRFPLEQSGVTLAIRSPTALSALRTSVTYCPTTSGTATSIVVEVTDFGVEPVVPAGAPGGAVALAVIGADEDVVVFGEESAQRRGSRPACRLTNMQKQQALKQPRARRARQPISAGPGATSLPMHATHGAGERP